MQPFDKAILKLAGLYAAILLVLSLGFSAAFYASVDHELNRPLAPFDDVRRSTFVASDDELHGFILQRDDELRAGLLARLVFINLAVLVFGALASYFLARLTLRPINDAMESESRFVSDASHELRTPLAAIVLENEVALRDEKMNKEALRAQIKSNLEEVDKLRELTRRLLSLSHAEPIECGEIDLATAVQTALDQVASRAAAKKITLDNQVASQQITSNVAALADILAILLDNAIKYSPAKTRITIAATERKITIVDQGTGIASADLPHIFERFYRAEASRTSEGFGLGLSLAQNLAEKIHAKISAENVMAKDENTAPAASAADLGENKAAPKTAAKDGRIVGAKFTIRL